jgi:hypothetical protein
MQNVQNAPLDQFELISVYSRADAIADGVQIDLSTLATEAGFKFPVFITQGAFAETVSTGGTWEEIGDWQTLELPFGQDTRGRVWDILNVLLWAIRRDAPGSRLAFKVDVYGHGGRPRAKTIQLESVCGPRDHDDPAPAITIMLPNED